MKKNIALVWGGYSSEIVVSEKSMHGIYSFLDKDLYNVYTIKIDNSGWTCNIDDKLYLIDKNDFSVRYKNIHLKFDFVYITIHGTPGEDGHLQGYFDLLKIPYSSCGLMTSSLTFNKFICNKYLKSFGLHVAESILLTRSTQYDINHIVQKLNLPLFVKPNTGGSSFATTKVNHIGDVQKAISTAFDEANEVIIESYLKGKEVTCGCFKINGKEIVLPITEVVTQNDFFDFNAKYMGEVEEITPARLSIQITNEIQRLTSNIYDWIGAKGIIRADFIIVEDIPYLLEVNTTPGMTSTSFIPQQVAVAGLSIKNVLTDIIENELKLYS